MRERPGPRVCSRRGSIVVGLVLAGLLSACAGYRPIPDPPAPPPATIPDEPTPAAPAEPPDPVTQASPAPPPPPSPPPPKHIAIVLSADKPMYEGIATQLAGLMDKEDYALYHLEGDTATAQSLFAAIGTKRKPIIVAIGLHAAKMARDLSDAPVVFCQVFNYESDGLTSDRMRGVASIPPLDQQLRLWKALNPDLRNVGVILGDQHDWLIDEAHRVTTAEDIMLHHRVASSDRETLYLFKRLVPSIDGLWLFPDNRILSPTVIKQIFAYSMRHGTQIVVFNPSFLKLGALMSLSSNTNDIAHQVLTVLQQLQSSGLATVPPMTALTEGDIRLNHSAVIRHGLKLPDEYTQLVQAP